MGQIGRPAQVGFVQLAPMPTKGIPEDHVASHLSPGGECAVWPLEVKCRVVREPVKPGWTLEWHSRRIGVERLPHYLRRRLVFLAWHISPSQVTQYAYRICGHLLRYLPLDRDWITPRTLRLPSVERL